jgi:hypothetical protein
VSRTAQPSTDPTPTPFSTRINAVIWAIVITSANRSAHDGFTSAQPTATTIDAVAATWRPRGPSTRDTSQLTRTAMGSIAASTTRIST